MEEIIVQDFNTDEMSTTELGTYDTSVNFTLDDAQLSTNFNVGTGVWFGMVALWLAMIGVMIASGWKVFTKAKLPGWGILVPIYNVYLQFKLAGHPNWAWWLLLPPVAAILLIVANFKIAKKFGKGTGFALGLWFLPIIFYPILAWGDAQYQEELSEEQK